jgi:hypothetical protein
MDGMSTISDAVPRRTACLADLRKQPPALTIPEAGRLGWGFGRAHSYQLAAAGQFPAPVLRVGQRHYVRTADLARALGIDPADLLTEE